MHLDEFIEKCSGQGRIESEGSFSVDSLAALRKTLASALPEPHYYLFQLLQSLVLAEASDIKVGIGRRENRISFHDKNRTFADLDEVAAKFQKGLSVAANSPLDLFMSGLVTALGCHIASAEFHSGYEKLVVSVNGLSRTKLSREASTPTIHLQRSLKRGLSYSWSRIWGARKEEFRIRKSFEYSPIPISVAGLDTSPRSGWRRALDGDERYALAEVAFLSAGRANHRGEAQEVVTRVPTSPFLHHCQAQEKRAEGSEVSVAPNLFFMAVDPEGTPLETAFCAEKWGQRQWTVCLTNGANAKANILFVRNGCTVLQTEADLGLPGLHLVAPADDLQVDATGYQLVKNKAFQVRMQQAQRKVQESKRILESQDLTTALQAMGKDPESILADFDWLNPAG